MAQSPVQNAATSEVIRYDLGWNAINALLRSGRSLSGHERNCCFLNLGGPRFANVSAATHLDFIDDGRVLALADWDYDGDIDFWITNRSGPQVRFIRNNIDDQNHYIALRLHGKECNRDAIGARIMLVDSTGRRQFRTRQAGQGYLAQSSSWIHIGLGNAERITRLVVRWPNGRRQTLEDLAADRHYDLHEGNPRPVVWPTPSWPALTPSELTAPPVSDQARIVLLKPIPLPPLVAQDIEGSPVELTSESDRPRLINLWASWCQPCIEELSQWSRSADELADAGLDVVTVNVDQENNSLGTISPTALQWITQLDFPFHKTWGTDTLTTHFDIVQRSVLSRQRPLPLPSSFLIDRHGHLRAIYKGPADVEQLLHDIPLVDADDQEIIAAAMPFEGRWLNPPNGSGPLQLAVKLIEAGLSDVAERYIRSLTGGRSDAEGIDASLSNLLGAIAVDKRDVTGATQAFRRALQQDPGNRQAHIELGSLLLRTGRAAEAVPHFEFVLQTTPNDPELWYKLGRSQFQAGDAARAEASLARSAELRPEATVYWHLGNVRVQRRKARDAIQAFESAIHLDPNSTSVANDLAWLLATTDDKALRDGDRALELAQAVCASTADPSASQLDTLAAAFAETGRFLEAQRTASKAVQMAMEANDHALAARIEQRREGYAQHQPYRDTSMQPADP